MKGKLSIGKVTCCGNSEEDYITIQIEDMLSSINFVEVKVDLLTFTHALFGLSNVPVEFELRGTERVGKKFECKSEAVVIPHTAEVLGLTNKEIDIAVGCYEIDGWIGNRENCKNHHRHIRSENVNGEFPYSVYEVHFVRWVDAEEE